MTRSALMAFALLLGAAVALPAFMSTAAQAKCERVYTSSGWITRC